MDLRNEPNVAGASGALKSELVFASDLGRARDLDLKRVLAFALGLARDLASALARDLAHSLAVEIALDLDGDLGLDGDLEDALARDLGRARRIARDLGLDSDLTRDLDRARARARDLGLTRDLDLDLARAGDLEFARALDLALDLARSVDRDLGGVLDRALNLSGAPTLDRALDLANAIIDVRTNHVCRVIGLVLHREPPVLDRNSVHALLDDFTEADLSTAELTAVGLVGVRWSEHGTQWPPSVDVGDFKAQSEETPLGSGIWVVRSGTTTVRGLIEL
ncbi:hypothetical protein [Streptomyces sp. SA15]|uniref:hypothetical protein n=1 Tax=Streptomyces sp. SA15 TaxID=934019 RepID=UPI00117E6A9A|nr:hypothetical protein [Streptomyces sp. SA15]